MPSRSPLSPIPRTPSRPTWAGRRRLLVATAFFVLLVSSPAAAVPSLESVEAPESTPGGEGVEPGDVLVDTFELYAPGRLPPQGGWTSTYDPIFTVVGFGIRGRSARHVSDGFGEFVTDVLISPVFGPSPGPVAVTVARSAGDARHQIVPVDLAAGLVLTRIELAPNGRILVAQLSGQGVVFVDTGRGWMPDEPLRIGALTDDQGRLEIFLNGESIFVGVDLVQATTGTAGRIEVLAFFGNNPDEGTRLLIDDVGPDPEGPPPEPSVVEIPALGPGSLGALAALLSFAAGQELRRRRRRRAK